MTTLPTLYNCTYGVDNHLIDLGCFSHTYTIARYHGVGFMSDEVKRAWIDVGPDKRIETWASYVLSKCRNSGDTGLAFIEHENYTEAMPLAERTQLMAIARAVRPGKRWVWSGYPYTHMGSADPGHAQGTKEQNDKAWPVMPDVAEGACPYLYLPNWAEYPAAQYRAACDWSLAEVARVMRPTAPVIPMFGIYTGGGERPMTDEELRAVFGACLAAKVPGIALFAMFWKPGDAQAWQDVAVRAARVVAEGMK